MKFRWMIFALLPAFGLFLLLEVASLAAYHWKSVREPLALIKSLEHLSWMYRSHLRSQRASQVAGPSLWEEQNAANRVVYQPWLQFKTADFHGRGINYEGQLRRSVPDRSCDSCREADFFDLFFVGGSTMYGFSVADSETIPSLFVQEYRRRFPTGRPIRVFNYGCPWYYSYQELLQVMDRIWRGDVPDAVVFLDGLNDFFLPQAALYRHPMYTTRLTGFMEGKPDTGDSWIYLNFPRDRDTLEVVHKITANYLENLRSARKALDAYQVRSWFFCQPVPFYNYPNRKRDTICTQDPFPYFEIAYPLVKKAAPGTPGLVFLGDMLAEETGAPFLDYYHYSPAFQLTLVRAMLDTMKL